MNTTAASPSVLDFPSYAQSGIDYYIHSFWAQVLTTFPAWTVTMVLPFVVLVVSYAVSCTCMFLIEYFFGDSLLRWKIQPVSKENVIITL